jgi:hypothetical protein
MIQLNSKEFVTGDSQLSAFLVARGFKPVRVEGPSFRRCFVFVNVPDEVPASFYRGTETINPQQLFEGYRLIKRLLHELS